MAATAPDHDADLQDQLRAWWKTFLNGAVEDEEEEVSEDSELEEEPDYDREEEEVGEERASAAATAGEVDQQRKEAVACIEKESSGGAALHGDDGEEIPEGGYVQQPQAGLLGSKRKVGATCSQPQAIGIEIRDTKDAGEEIPEDTYVEIVGRREPILSRSKRQATGNEIQDGKGEGIPEDASVQLRGDLVGRRREAIMTRSKMRVDAIENHNQKEDKISEDTYVEPEGGVQGRKRKANVAPGKLQTTGIEIQDKKGHAECQRAESGMLRRQLVRKTKEVQAERTRRLKLELNVKDKELKSLEKQTGHLRAENIGRPQRSREAKTLQVL